MPLLMTIQETKKKNIKIDFRNKIYEINIEKLYFVIKTLKEDKTIKFKNYKKTVKYLKELGLFNEEFLNNINNI